MQDKRTILSRSPRTSRRSRDRRRPGRRTCRRLDRLDIGSRNEPFAPEFIRNFYPARSVVFFENLDCTTGYVGVSAPDGSPSGPD